MPELIWKAYLDSEIALGALDNARALYRRLLEVFSLFNNSSLLFSLSFQIFITHSIYTHLFFYILLCSLIVAARRYPIYDSFTLSGKRFLRGVKGFSIPLHESFRKPWWSSSFALIRGSRKFT